MITMYYKVPIKYEDGLWYKMKTAMKSKVSVELPVFTGQRHGCWIAYCPPIKLYGYSETDEKGALDDFDKAVDTFFHVQETLK